MGSGVLSADAGPSEISSLQYLSCLHHCSTQAPACHERLLDNQFKEVRGEASPGTASRERKPDHNNVVQTGMVWLDTPSAAECPRPLALAPESSPAHRPTHGQGEWSPCSGISTLDAKKWFFKWKSGRMSRCRTTKEQVIPPQPLSGLR